MRTEKKPEVRDGLSHIIDDLKDGTMTEITSMPACNYTVDVSRIPSPTPTDNDANTINLDYVRTTIFIFPFFSH